MGEVRRAVKRNAKQVLRGHWGRASAILLILLGACLILALLENGIRSALGLSAYLDVNGTAGYYPDDLLNTGLDYLLFSLGMALFGLMFTAPLYIGAAGWFLERTGGGEEPVSDIFWPYGCKTFFSAIWLKILIFFGRILWGLLLLAPPAGIFGWTVYALSGPAPSPGVEALCITALAASLALLLLAAVFWAAMVTR